MPGPGFNWVFGGSAVQPAQASYLALALSANTTLVWPPQAPTGSTVAARIMDVTPSAPGLTLSMPPANQTSAGWDALVTNKGASTFTLATNTGSVIASIAPGQQYYVYLVDPTTQSGTWNITLFGTGSSSITASAVAGTGLIAIGATLSPNFVTATSNSSPITLNAATDRSAQYVWTGGTGVVNLPQLSLIPSPDGYFVTINNKGTGTLTITPNGGDFLDGANATEAMNPGYAATFFASTSGWYSFGPLATTKFNFTELIVTATNGNLSGVSGGGGVTLSLSTTQAANVVQKYQGAITANQTVVFPPTVQVYYVQNATSGAYTVSFKSGAGTTVAVPQNQNAILFSDGVNVVNASNIIGSFNSVTLASGSAASPTMTFATDPSTGLYLPASGQLGFAISGVQGGLLTSAGFTAPAFIPSGSAVPTNGMYLPSANTVGFGISSAEAARLSPNRNLLVGSAVDNNAAQKLQITGKQYVSDTSGATLASFQISSSNAFGGAGYATFLDLFNAGGGSNAHKYIRTDSSGTLGVVNSAGSTGILLLDDSGNLTVTGAAAATIHKATPSAPTPSSGVNSFGHLSSGSYGGGYGLLDGSYAWGIWDNSGTLTFGSATTGGAASLLQRMSLDGSGNLVAGGNITASGGTMTATTFSGNATTATTAGSATTATTATTANSLNTGNSYTGVNFTATGQFNGPGTGLTGTAASLNIGGLAATATTATTATTANSLNTGNSYTGVNFTASGQFSGPGTGLTGTAASLTVGTATVANGVSSTATGTTQAIGDTSTKLATDAFVNPGSSIGALGSNGYRKMPDGSILQWGTATSSAGSVTVGFPLTFPNVCIGVIATATNLSSSPASGSIAFIYTGSITAGQFVARTNDPSNAVTTTQFSWIAIGH